MEQVLHWVPPNSNHGSDNDIFMGKVLWIYRRCLSTWFVILELLWRHLPSVTSFMSYYGLSRLSYYTFHLPDSVCLLNKLLKNHSEKHFEHLNLLPLKAYIARQAGREREMSMVLSNFTVVVLSQKNLNLPPFFSVSQTYCYLGTSDISFPFYEGKPVLFSEQYGKVFSFLVLIGRPNILPLSGMTWPFHRHTCIFWFVYCSISYISLEFDAMKPL